MIDNILLFKNDLPKEFLDNVKEVAIDTEAMGLYPHRDRLCIAQFCKGDNISYIIQFDNYQNADNIKNILHSNNIIKIFHYARFDVMMLYKYLGVMTHNIYCTKIASKLVR
ncbi:MAG: ribonuclease D, partial [Alphaproteobacteria bacterium]|nr:ribonuclease D [Alphaproteobacteria bacterium]